MSVAYSVILPAYNEGETLETAVRETAAVFRSLGAPFEIVVIDDGSADATLSVAEKLAQEFSNLRLLKHEANLGKGSAVRTGVMNAQGDHLLFLDCDLATHPREALKFVAVLPQADIVIGSRSLAGAVIAARQPWYRILFGKGINFFVRHFLKLPHQDTQCGFKMFKREVAQDIFRDLSPARWTFDIELLLRAQANGYRVLELPVTWTAHHVSRVRAVEVLSDLGYLLKLRNKLNE